MSGRAGQGISTAHVHNLIHDCADGMESSEAMALLDGALSQVASVRSACLEALKKVSSLGGESASNEEEETHQISARIFLLRYDDNEDVSSVADELWSESFSGVDVGKLINLSIDFLSHENDNVRSVSFLNSTLALGSAWVYYALSLLHVHPSQSVCRKGVGSLD